jgi:hypothetical protein
MKKALVSFFQTPSKCTKLFVSFHDFSGSSQERVCLVRQDDQHYTLQKIHQVSFSRPALNFTHGLFGKSKGSNMSKAKEIVYKQVADVVCIQSLDGSLTFIENSIVQFSVVRPDVMLPGPICYHPTIDALITTTPSQHGIASFRQASK